MELENRLLRERLRLVLLQKYGAKSDKLSDLQLRLLESEPCVTSEDVAAEADRVAKNPAARTPRVPRERSAKHPGRVELPAHLERRIEVIPALPKECSCGKVHPVIGYEVSEYLEIEPVKFFVRQVRREKLGGCACQDGVKCAPLPVRILPKSKLGDELIVEMIDQKFGMHVPVFRQCEAIFRHTGIDLSRQTVCGVISKVGDLLVPISQVLRAERTAFGTLKESVESAAPWRESIHASDVGLAKDRNRPDRRLGSPVP